MEHPSVAIVIPAKNEARYIKQCLSSLRAQDYPPERISIVVVDNGSTDGTREIAAESADHVFLEPTLNLSQLRNFGVANTTSEVLAFIDADCIANRDWLMQGVRSLQIEDCITGSFHGSPEDGTWLEKAWFCQSPRGRTRAAHINTSNLFVKRDLFEKLGGFDESLTTGEDAEFSTRAAQHVAVISDDTIHVVHLGNPKTLSAFMRREMWHGLGALGSFKHDWFDKPLLGTIAFTILTVVQLIAILAMSWQMFFGSSLAVAALLLATLVYRASAIRDARHAVQLAALYYVYYLARGISLLRVVGRIVSARFRAA